VCSGAFVVGAAGLLDGRACTTHWMHADELARLYPTANVDRNVLFVDDGNLITSAGTAAGIDACLHLVRRELGSAATNIIARRMVVPPQRDGGQRQYIDQPIPVRCSEGFAPQLDWILTNLDKPHTVGTLADRAHMSARTFARRFVDETGTTPMQWVTDQRVLFARRLLEETDLDIDRIADRAGFGTATLLRHHFRRIIGVTPSDYRRSFACDAVPETA
jgi:transcriptional regulator GlxA family with amidase domain